MVNSAVGAYYYLRIIVAMYMREGRKPVPASPIPFGLGIALAVSMGFTLYLGLLPNRVLQNAQESARELIQRPVGAPSDAAPGGASAAMRPN